MGTILRACKRGWCYLALVSVEAALAFATPSPTPTGQANTAANNALQQLAQNVQAFSPGSGGAPSTPPQASQHANLLAGLVQASKQLTQQQPPSNPINSNQGSQTPNGGNPPNVQQQNASNGSANSPGNQPASAPQGAPSNAQQQNASNGSANSPGNQPASAPQGTPANSQQQGNAPKPQSNPNSAWNIVQASYQAGTLSGMAVPPGTPASSGASGNQPGTSPQGAPTNSQQQGNAPKPQSNPNSAWNIVQASYQAGTLSGMAVPPGTPASSGASGTGSQQPPPFLPPQPPSKTPGGTGGLGPGGPASTPPSSTPTSSNRYGSRTPSSTRDNTTGMMMGIMSGNPMLGMMGGGDCSTSEAIDSKYACSTTRNLTMGAQLSNTMGQQVGSMALQSQAQTAQMRAMMQPQTQANYLQASIDTMEAAANQTITQGTMNAALGAMQFMRAKKHGTDAKELQAAGEDTIIEQNNMNRSQSNSQLTNKIIQRSGSETNTTVAEATESVQKMATDAASEQREVEGTAMMGGLMSLMTGFSQLSQGAMQKTAASQMNRSLAAMRMQPTPQPSMFANRVGGGIFAPAPQTPGFGAGGTTGANGTTIGPVGGTSGSGGMGGADPDPTMSGLPDGGAAFLPGVTPTGLPNAPPAGQFTPDQGGGAGGGGGGGVDAGGGGGTAPSDVNMQGGMGPVGPMVEGASYQAGGGGAGASGGGSYSSGPPPKGNGNNDGMDFAGLLGRFLPQKQQEDSRAPATQEQLKRAAAVYPEGVNMFDRVHEQIQNQRKTGAI